LQNRESGGSSVPHDPHNSPTAVTAPRPSPVPPTSVSCHRWSAMSVISPSHLRDEVFDPHMWSFLRLQEEWCALGQHPGPTSRGESGGRSQTFQAAACTAAPNLPPFHARGDMTTAGGSPRRGPRAARGCLRSRRTSSLRHRKLVPNAPQSQVASASIAAIIVASSSGSEPA
jgi:hypothetical protein